MDNPGDCSVCFTTFDESERRPRTLPCGHTFCSLCIVDMMDGGHLSCPTCRANHPATSVTQLPISYIAEAFVKQIKAMKLSQASTRQEPPGITSPPPEATAGKGVKVVSAGATGQKQTSGIGRKLQSVLEEQTISVSSVVVSSQEVQSQLDQYRAQLADWKTQHLQLLDRLYDLVNQNKAALELLEQEDIRVLGMKKEGEEGKKQLEAVLGCLHTVNTAQEVGTATDHADHCTVEAEDWMKKCQEVFPDVNTVNTSMKVRGVTRTALETAGIESGAAEDTIQLEESASPLMEKLKLIIQPLYVSKTMTQVSNVKQLCSMRPYVKRLVEAGRVFGVQEDQGGLRSSRITLENCQLYLHCLLDQTPPPHASTLPVGEVVGALDPSSTLVFLELSWPGSTRGRVHIRLSPDTSLARQFVLLCTGQRGHSYLNTVLFGVGNKGGVGEYVEGGDYQYNNGKGGAPLLPHPKVQYLKSGRAGTVWSMYRLGSNYSAQFAISTREYSEQRPLVFGEVVSGLEVVMAAVNHSDIQQVTVVDCGVVVPL